MTNFEQSKEITEGLRQSFQSADSKVANRACYGYTTLPNGDLTINECEATIVHWIFARYIAGDSLGKIATELEKQGIQSPTGNAKWNREAILYYFSIKTFHVLIWQAKLSAAAEAAGEQH